MYARAAALLLALPLLAAACASDGNAPQDAQSLQPSQSASDDQDDGAQPAASQLAPQDEDAQDAAPPLAASPLAPAPYDPEYALSIVRSLSLELGPRPSGTDDELRAAQWLAGAFRELGYQTRLHEFPAIPAGPDPIVPADLYSAGEPLSRAVFIEGSPLRAAAGPLAYSEGLGVPDDFAGIPAGAIAVAQRGELTFAAKALNAASAGAAALVVVNYDNGPIRAELDQPVDIPVIIVPDMARDAIQRANGRTAEIIAPTAAGADPDDETSWPQSRNVIAQLPAADCRVYVGAHYDSVPAIPGANDNASGTAILLALARAYAETAAAAHICFAAFGSEEIGLVGSIAFVQDLLQDDALAQTRAMLNLDALGNGSPPIFIVGDPALTAMTAGLAARLGIAVSPNPPPPDLASDHVPFQDEGIPVLAVFVPDGILHVPADTFDNLDPDLMARLGRLAHAALACTLQRVGAPVQPPLPCESAE